ncbi:MAG: glycosyltransferase family 4 protein [Actinobacteria bacterium]|nr:glycosyltransferase family 4 protein [Actinomycetota bacterium]
MTDGGRSERPLRLCSIAKHVYRLPLESNDRDVRVYREVNRALGAERLYLVVQAADRRFRVERSGDVVAVYLPSLRHEVANHAWFVLGASVVGAALTWGRGIAVIQASDVTGGALAGVAVRTLTRRPLLVHLQGDLFHLPPETGRGRVWLAARIARFVCRRADLVRCISQDLVRKAAAAGVPASRLALVPSRCDTAQFDPARYPQAREAVRRRLGIPAGEVVLLFAGALSVHKGVRHLIEAMGSLLRERDDVTCLVAGSGRRNGELRALARDLGVEHKARFLGSVPYSQMPELMAAADVFVLPSLDEGMPRVVLEAMAMELPVVGSSVGGIPEMVREGETGSLVPAGDSAALAGALGRLLEDRARAAEWGAAGRRVVVAEFSFERGIRRYAEALARLLPSRASRAVRDLELATTPRSAAGS